MARLSFTTLRTEAQGEGYAHVLAHCYARPLEEARTWVTRYTPDRICLLADPRDDSPGGVAAGLVLIDMGHFFGGDAVPGVGVAGVGVAPHHRGRGTATLLMDRCVKHLRGLGVALSGLYPATQALYRRSGYELAGHRCHLRMPLSKIDVRERGAKVRPGTDADRDAIRRVYRQWARSTDGALERSPPLWMRAEMIPPARREPASCFVVEGEKSGRRGAPAIEGYVYMHMPAGPDGKPEVHVVDMAATTRRAALRLWSFLASHSTICTDLVWHCTPAHPMLTLLDEPGFKLSLHMYWMLRVIDARAALEARGYPRGLRAELAFDLTDPLLRANSGRLVARVQNGRAEVERDPRRTFRGPALKLGVDALACLYSGFQPARHLRMMERLEGDEEAIDVAGAIFGGQTPAMCEMF